VIFKKDKYILIVGCGRFGASIAGTISGAGSNVVLIDKKKEAFRKLSPAFSGFTLEGDACDINVLKTGGIEKADIIIVATQNDNVNVMVSQVASKIFQIKEVYVRLYDPDKEILLDGYDIKKIYPARLSLMEFERLAKEHEADVPKNFDL
jgi:trk system potassium uptake protein TrkA